MWRAPARCAMLAAMMLLATCCLIGALANGSTAASPHTPWEPLLADPKSKVEIDRTRVSRAHGFVEIWVRSRGQPESIAQEFVAAGESPERVERIRTAFERSEHLWSFHCEAGTHALAYSAYYATDGSLIRDFNVGRRAYWPVVPDTVGTRLLHAACGEPGAKRAGIDFDDAFEGTVEVSDDDGSTASSAPR
jgi:hypothetical protein